MALAIGTVLASAALMGVLWRWLGRHTPIVEFRLGTSALRFENPRWLAILACAPYVFVAAALSLTDHGPARRGLQGAVRLLFLGLLAAVLARPALRREDTAVSLVALVDVSASVTDAQLADETRFLESVTRIALPTTTVRVVQFAATPEEVTHPARIPGSDGTDVGLALSLGLGLLEPGRVPRLLVLSDGRATSGDAMAEATRAAERGARLFYRLPTGDAPPDVAVLDLTAPDEVQPHATFDLEMRLLATHAGSARLRLEEERTTSAEQTVALQPGLNTVRWPRRIDRPGTVVYRAEVLTADRNTRADNDVGVLAVVPRPKPRVLVLEASGPGALPVRRAWTAEGFDVEARPPHTLGETALAGIDLLVLSDVPRSGLSAVQQELIERFVRQGGGMLVAGGPDSFGSGGYANTRIQALLPVRHDPNDQRQEASLALALVIDRSGSMSGPKMELTKEAARGTAQMLAPEDLISVVVFDSQSHSVVRLQTASNRQRILNDIAQIRASGGTNILPGLREAFDQLVNARARKKHVILLSDGQSPYEGIPELIDDAVAARITVSAVGVGEGADQTLLQMIATRGGGRFYHTRDPASIPQIFTRETAEISRSSVVERPTRLRQTKAAEMLAGLSFDAAPPLRGYTRTKARKEADMLLATGEGDPLLARWQVGLGQVVAWTSDLSARWSADLARWSSFPKLWGQIARSTMRRGAASHFPIRARIQGGRVVATMDAVGGDDRPLTGLVGRLEVMAFSVAAGKTASNRHEVELAEGLPGRYEADFPIGEPGALLLTAHLVAPVAGTPVADGHGRLALPFGREILPPAPDDPTTSGRTLLQALADRTGGAEAATAEAVLAAGRDRSSSTRSLRTPLLLAALVLFLADLALRRVKFPRS